MFLLTLSKKLELQGFVIIHTDDYMKYGYKDSLYKLLDDIKNKDLKNVVIEGVLGYRLLRKGEQLNCYKPDIVIELKSSIKIILNRYKNNRQDKNIKSVLSMIKSNNTILNEYFSICKKIPEWEIIESNG